jgi:hypothetical protein
VTNLQTGYLAEVVPRLLSDRRTRRRASARPPFTLSSRDGTLRVNARSVFVNRVRFRRRTA